jgi:hypothetical protein
MPATDSRLAGAFERLKDAKQRATGVKEFILIDGRKVEALVSEIRADEAIISGGIAQAGGFRCQVACSEFADPPAKFTEITVRGNDLQVLSVNDVNGVVYDLTAGDPASEGQ